MLRLGLQLDCCITKNCYCRVFFSLEQVVMCQKPNCCSDTGFKIQHDNTKAVLGTKRFREHTIGGFSCTVVCQALITWRSPPWIQALSYTKVIGSTRVAVLVTREKPHKSLCVFSSQYFHSLSVNLFGLELSDTRLILLFAAISEPFTMYANTNQTIPAALHLSFSTGETSRRILMWSSYRNLMFFATELTELKIGLYDKIWTFIW